MEVRRKIAALFFALLVIFINATYYSVVSNKHIVYSNEDNENVCFTSFNEANYLYLQHKTSSSEYQGWKVEVRIPGLYAQNKCLCEPLQLKVIRKIFVVDSYAFTPCKSIILYPFHEFS